AEWHRLFREMRMGAGIVIRTGKADPHDKTAAQRCDDADEQEAQPRIRARRENLSHPARPAVEPTQHSVVEPCSDRKSSPAGTLLRRLNYESGRSSSARALPHERDIGPP